MGLAAHIPGNIFQENWKAAVFIDDKASSKQEEALLNVFTGKLGGPVADMCKLVGEIVTVQRSPIRFEVVDGKSKLATGAVWQTAPLRAL